MRSLVFSVSLVICLSLTGQDYKPLVVEGNSWSIVSWSWGWGWTNYLFLDGDTIINDITYSKVYITTDSTFQNDVSFHGGIREDTVNKEVFFYYNSNVGEIMLYRFGMEIGDTAIVSSMACESINMIVTDIDTIIDMHGIERPRMLMDPWYYWYDEYWIEGIGSSLGLLTAGNFSCIADFNQELLCFSYDEDLAYMNPLYEKCFITEVGIDDKIKEAESIMIIPNPVIGKSTIKLPSGVNIQEMIVLDSYGRTKEILWTTSSYLNKDDYTPGVYFLRIQTEKKVYTSKFIIR